MWTLAEIFKFINEHNLPLSYGEGENSDLLEAYIKGYTDAINKMLSDINAIANKI